VSFDYPSEKDLDKLLDDIGRIHLPSETDEVLTLLLSSFFV